MANIVKADKIPANLSVLHRMAQQYHMDPTTFHKVVMQTVMPTPNVTPERVAAFMLVASKYELDPFTKQIYAFEGKGGGVVPIVGIDGWMSIANREPHFDGLDFEQDMGENGVLKSITCILHHKNRAHPIRVTEYMNECRRNTPPWNQSPNRMLRHRATAQAIRYAFGIGGLALPDEYEQGEYSVENEVQPMPEIHIPKDEDPKDDEPKPAAKTRKKKEEPKDEPPPAQDPPTTSSDTFFGDEDDRGF